MPLTSQQIAAWKANGFLRLDTFLDEATAQACVAWIDEIQQWPDSTDRWMHHYEHTPEGIRHARTENVVPYHTPLRDLLVQGAIVDAVSALFGEQAVLYKEKINYKYPGGGGYAPHQDAVAYHGVSKHITCLVPTGPVSVENGCLYFSPYPHDDRLLPTDEKDCIAADTAAEMDWLPQELGPRDVLFFHSYAPHKSGPNTSPDARRILYVTYNALSEGDLREAYYREKRALFARFKKEDPENKGQRISSVGHFQGDTVVRQG